MAVPGGKSGETNIDLSKNIRTPPIRKNPPVDIGQRGVGRRSCRKKTTHLLSRKLRRPLEKTVSGLLSFLASIKDYLLGLRRLAQRERLNKSWFPFSAPE